MKLSPPEVVVVGGGAAGLFAARSAALRGARVLLLEKTARLGTKILISGGGKCNLAHAGPLEDVIRAFERSEAVFLRPSCYRMPNSEIIRYFEDCGLELTTRSDGRVFPARENARTVLRLLVEELVNLKVRIFIGTSAEKVRVQDGEVASVDLSLSQKAKPLRKAAISQGFGAKALLRDVIHERSLDGALWEGPSTISCKHLVVCCGGSSYPNSGTTGDGYRWAREWGHTVVKPRAALAPIYLKEPLAERSGVSHNCRLVARLNNRKAAESDGDLLITHQGVSGPVVLDISRKVAVLMEQGTVSLEVDFAPDKSAEDLQHDWSTGSEVEPLRTLQQHLLGFCSGPFAMEILRLLDLQGRTLIRGMGRASRNRAIEILKGWPLGIVSAVPLERGEVTAGGISLNEVDPKTMRSRLVKGLYLAGEILDLAGPVGGYNLQAAFATGFVAGETAAKDALANA